MLGNSRGVHVYVGTQTLYMYVCMYMLAFFRQYSIPYLYVRLSVSLCTCTCVCIRVRRHSCFVHVEGGRSIVLASQGCCCTRGVGWNRIYSIRRWHINRTDNNTSSGGAAANPIYTTRRASTRITKIRVAWRRCRVASRPSTEKKKKKKKRRVHFVPARPALPSIVISTRSGTKGKSRAQLHYKRIARARNLLVIHNIYTHTCNNFCARAFIYVCICARLLYMYTHVLGLFYRQRSTMYN